MERNANGPFFSNIAGRRQVAAGGSRGKKTQQDEEESLKSGQEPFGEVILTDG